MFLATDALGRSFTAKTLGSLSMEFDLNDVEPGGFNFYHYGKQFSIDLTQVEPELPPEPLLMWTARIPMRMRPATKTTHGGKHSPEAKSYLGYQDRLLSACLAQGFETSWDVYSIRVVGIMALPEYCFKKDGTLNNKGLAMSGSPYRIVPDMDNSIKPVADALIPRNDAGVVHMEGDKVYGVDRADALIAQVEYYPTRSVNPKSKDD